MSNDPVEGMRDLVDEYALGLLDASECAAFEAALTSDSELRQLLDQTRQALTAMALSTPIEVPESLKARVMAQATTRPSAETSTATLPFRRSRAPRLAVALGLALAASLLLMVRLSSDLREERSTRALAQADLAQFADVLAQRDSLIQRLTDPETELIVLAATGDAKPAVKVYLDRVRRTGVLTIASLDAAPAGQTYQLWFIVDGAPVPSVTFQTDGAGRALISRVVLPGGTIAATAITREPVGGSTTPTAPILFVGSVRAD